MTDEPAQNTAVPQYRSAAAAFLRRHQNLLQCWLRRHGLLHLKLPDTPHVHRQPPAARAVWGTLTLISVRPPVQARLCHAHPIQKRAGPGGSAREREKKDNTDRLSGWGVRSVHELLNRTCTLPWCMFLFCTSSQTASSSRRNGQPPLEIQPAPTA